MRRRRGKRERSSPPPPLRAATTAEASSVGAVPCCGPVAIAPSLLTPIFFQRRRHELTVFLSPSSAYLLSSAFLDSFFLLSEICFAFGVPEVVVKFGAFGAG
ncbi:hypothetical protein PIB30_032225 [Stylosanthes scabra]|uniref:Uncharacterized protein n=1 Tax=Stylosanthes scabra TaxID=79078 RepID=A0ABU6TBT9_9FABA|nr:hypothetical protein [Stylosanthes scabra]